MPKPTAIIEVEEDFVFKSPFIYANELLPANQLTLPPHELLDSADPVRPGESKQEHKQRVQELVQRIKEDGQRQPITVCRERFFDIGSGPHYRVVDGQGRLEALRILDLPAWCVLLDDSVDPWSAAVKLNVQRKNYNDLQLALLMKEARTRLNLNGKQVAAMFGIKEPLLVEYGKIADAPAAIQEAVQSGELNRSAALKLIESTPGATPERQKQVVEKAKEIAVVEGVKSHSRILHTIVNHPGPLPDELFVGQPYDIANPPAPSPKPRVQARHVAEAARAIATEAHEDFPAIKRSKPEILAAISSLADLMPGDPEPFTICRSFLEGIQEFADGLITPKQLQNRWKKVLVIHEKRQAAQVAQSKQSGKA